jgi:cell division protein FtsZ
MADFVYQSEYDPDVNIKVVGVGGGGGNALNCNKHRCKGS